MKGQLTEQIQKLSLRYIGREITTEELRLIPYVQYTLVNSNKIDLIRIDDVELNILKKWKSEGLIKRKSDILSPDVTRKFWDYMNEVLWFSYVGK